MTTSISPATTALPQSETIVAYAQVPNLAVFDSRSASTPRWSLPNPRALGGPLVLVVTAQIDGWIRAELPVQPNGTLGWIRASGVRLEHHDFKIVVSLSAHRITVTQGQTVIDDEPIGVGTEATPTPGGTYYTIDFVKITTPGSPYGPYAYGLSGFSNVVTTFGGAPGQLAIHGTNDPAGIGHDVSHGCIRMSNAGITKLAGILPLGVPVIVVA